MLSLATAVILIRFSGLLTTTSGKNNSHFSVKFIEKFTAEHITEPISFGQ